MNVRGSRGVHGRRLYDFTPGVHSNDIRRVGEALIVSTFKTKPHQTLRVQQDRIRDEPAG